MNHEQVFDDDELDSEWAQYVASLQQDDQSQRNRHKENIVKREQETMNNLQRHIRGLSRARFVLTDAINSDIFDDTCSSSDDEGVLKSNQIAMALPTPLAESNFREFHSEESDEESCCHADSDEHGLSDSESIAPLPQQSSLFLQHSLSSLSRKSSRHIRSGGVTPYSPNTPLSSLLEKRLSIKDCNGTHRTMDPLIDDRDSEDYLDVLDAVDSQDSEEYEVNDSHSLLSANGSRDSQYECSGSDEEDAETRSSKFSPSNCSNPSNDSSRPSEDEMPELHYDEELEALRKELNAFKRKNRQSHHLRRTKSREEVLLSVLNIDHKTIDAEQLEKCTENAMAKYNTMAREEKKAAKRRSKIVSRSLSQSLMIESNCNQLVNTGSLLQCVDDERSMSLSPETVSPAFNDNIAAVTVDTDSPSEKMEKEKLSDRPLADPYDEEWNGLDPDDYFWDDDCPEGDCYDDDKMSVRDRRVQYLVVMAVDNGFCSISDLTYEQNELLLMYQEDAMLL